MILKYFHIQTSAIQRKYPTLIVRIFLVSVRTHSISRYIHIQTLCVHKQNVLRFLQHGTYHVVVRGGLHFCQSPKGGGSGVFLLKRKGGPTLFWEKNAKIPQPPPPPQEKTYLPLPGQKCRGCLVVVTVCLCTCGGANCPSSGLTLQISAVVFL